LTVTDKYFCTVSAPVTITQPNPIIVFANGDTTICTGASLVNISASAAGGTLPYTYLWLDSSFVNPNSSSQFVSPDVPTTYNVIVYDANGCLSPVQGVVNVGVYPGITVSISSDAILCEGDDYNINVVASGGNGSYNYFWSNGTGNPNIVTPFVTTTYTVTVSDGCGSTPDTASMTITVQKAPDLVRDPRFQKGCVPFLADFDCIASVITGGISYEWNFGDPSTGALNISNDSVASHIYGLPGAYDITLTLTSDYGCDYTQTFNDLVIVDPIPAADFYYTPTEGIDAFHGEVHFYAQTDPNNDVTWYFENGGNSASDIMDPVYLYTQPGIYDVLLVVSSNGCIDTVIKTIKVNDVFTLWAPTAFYPGTGVGDGYFYPKGNGFDPRNYYLAIYDRWGQIIFETTEYPEGTSMRPDDVRTQGNSDENWLPGGWNGGKNNDINKLVPIGTYTWYCKVRAKDSGDLHEETGPVTVIR
jgi:PKD repeat protein